MAITKQQIEELEEYFATVDIPKTNKINNAITFLDLPKFVKENLQKLKESTVAQVVIAPRYDDLLEIKKALSEG